MRRQRRRARQEKRDRLVSYRDRGIRSVASASAASLLFQHRGDEGASMNALSVLRERGRCMMRGL
jgi:hypothetical protein